MDRPILTKQLLNTTPDKENMIINTVQSYLVLWSWLRQQFSCVWSVRVKHIWNATPTNCVDNSQRAVI